MEHVQDAHKPAHRSAAESVPHSTDSVTPAVQRVVNDTGLPDNLKAGIENLSGYSMNDVKVHYNSAQPSQLQAHAYAQGTDIHVAPGQERHLPHEAWHVVQQKQGRVKPTMQLKGKVNVNDDAGLEKEADAMGSKAIQLKNDKTGSATPEDVAPPTESTPLGITKFITDHTEGSGMAKTEFLTTLKIQVTQAANEVLAHIHQTAADCPYIMKWFGYYAERDAAYIETAIARYAPQAPASASVNEYMEKVVKRVKMGLRHHVETGSMDDVPAELVEERHSPEDFLHMAQKKQDVAQLSCLSKPHEPEAGPVQAPPVRRPMHSLLQGHTIQAAPGDRVINVGTTACGLVLGFCENGIACFHWPFMTVDAGHIQTFRRIVDQVGTLRHIEIITNDFPSQQQEAGYIQSAQQIRDTFGVATSYYVRNGQLVGDPMGQLIDDHFVSGGLRHVPLP